MLKPRIEGRTAGVGVRSVQIMEHTLTTGGVTHQDNLATRAAIFGCLVLLDVSYALGNLICVPVKMSEATCLI